MSKKRLSFRALVLTALCFAVMACEAVIPLEPYDSWEFEGYTVHSYVPDQPVGIVYLFHGAYGSANFAKKVETVDATNELVARGYAVVATESTLRTGKTQWVVDNPSLSGNPDLARLARLHLFLINSTTIDWQTPIFGIGMSNGARMVSLFGQSFSNAGFPVAAIAPFMGRVAAPVKASGGIRVPAFFVTAANDTTTNNSEIQTDYDMALLNGVPTLFFVKPEEPLLPIRFTRIPAINVEQANLLHDLLFSTGAWDADGQRIVPVEETIDRFSALVLPRELAEQASGIKGQVKAMLALHQFVGVYKLQLADFFDDNLPGATAQ